MASERIGNELLAPRKSALVGREPILLCQVQCRHQSRELRVVAHGDRDVAI